MYFFLDSAPKEEEVGSKSIDDYAYPTRTDHSSQQPQVVAGGSLIPMPQEGHMR
jgi:hypothetical protein